MTAMERGNGKFKPGVLRPFSLSILRLLLSGSGSADDAAIPASGFYDPSGATSS
jgi:hypothetical protein